MSISLCQQYEEIYIEQYCVYMYRHNIDIHNIYTIYTIYIIYTIIYIKSVPIFLS